MHFSISVVFALLLFINYLCCNIFKLSINPFILIRKLNYILLLLYFHR